MARAATFRQLASADGVRRMPGWLGAVLSLNLLASCGDPDFYFSASVQPGGGQTVAVNGQTGFASYLWWQHFDSYEQSGQVDRLTIEAWAQGVPIVIDTIGPGYCHELCNTDWCQAGLVAEETVRVVVNSPLIITGGCIDYDGNRYDISK